MRIISKFKDYYDYLQGIYGVDEKLVLDRTKFTASRTPSIDGQFVVEISIAGLTHSAYETNGRYYWGEEIEEFEKKVPKYSFNWYSYEDCYNIPQKFNRYNFLHIPKNPVKTDINEKLDCPIVLGKDNVFPILSHYDFHKVMSAEALWIEISNWMGRPRDIPSIQSNKDKILSAGFDLKTSFRK